MYNDKIFEEIHLISSILIRLGGLTKPGTESQHLVSMAKERMYDLIVAICEEGRVL